MLDTPAWIEERLLHADCLGLFLDYDGTLAEFAPTPEQVEPEPALVDLVQRLAQNPRLQVAVISGRRLEQLEKLLPGAGCLLAGTYGIEWIQPEGERGKILDFRAVRTVLDDLKTVWAAIAASHPDTYLEDKGWSLALHARFAGEVEAEQAIAAARQSAARLVDLESRDSLFRQHSGPRFYEICPAPARKGRTVERLLVDGLLRGSLPVYLGDDYNDEEAFDTIHAHGGIAILVADEPRATEADMTLPNPQAARRWLEELLEILD